MVSYPKAWSFKLLPMKKLHLFTACSIAAIHLSMGAHAQPVMETGGQKMPDEWIDRDTHHKVVKLSRIEGQNGSFYFHNNPFYKNKMVFYNTNNKRRQIYTLDLVSLKAEQLTNQSSGMNGEIVGQKTGNVYYQIKDSVFLTNINNKETKLLFVFPADYKGSITTINADETFFAGAKASEAQKEIYRQYPDKSQYFNRIFDAHLPNDLFTIDIKKKSLDKIHTENTWLGHVQFSPVDPRLLMFCHEGPWHKIDRIWTINVKTKEVKLMHKRTMDMEIAGHEFFAPDGKIIYYDLQQPRSEKFYLAGTDVNTLLEKKYELTRDEWSIHFNVSTDQKMFCGDGGNDTQVAKAKDGMWIYAFTPEGDHFKSERLVNMKHHGYKLEPNVHYSPDGKWVIFHANFEGVQQVYAAELKRSE
jgi:oligogalacturonide lyase